MTKEQILAWLDKNNRGFTQKDFELFMKFHEEVTGKPRKNHWYEMYELECLKTKELEKQIEKMKSDSKTAYIKGIRTMANALKRYDRTEGACTDYFEHTVDTVLKNLLKEVGL